MAGVIRIYIPKIFSRRPFGTSELCSKGKRTTQTNARLPEISIFYSPQHFRHNYKVSDCHEVRQIEHAFPSLNINLQATR